MQITSATAVQLLLRLSQVTMVTENPETTFFFGEKKDKSQNQFNVASKLMIRPKVNGSFGLQIYVDIPAILLLCNTDQEYRPRCEASSLSEGSLLICRSYHYQVVSLRAGSCCLCLPCQDILQVVYHFSLSSSLVFEARQN